jgi:chromosome segregation ATPase
MPAKSPTELTTELGILAERHDNTRRDLGALKREIEAIEQSIGVRTGEAGTLRTELTNEIHKQQTEMQAAVADLRQELALVRQRLDEHLKRVELWDSRRWGFIIAIAVALFGASASYTSGLIIASLRK